LARPFPDLGIGFGAAVDLGTESSVDASGFKCAWRDYSALLVVSWTLPIAPLEIEPWLGGGLAISAMSGLQNGVGRDESATLATVAGGVWVRRRFGMWSIGGSLGAQSMLDTPTYTKPDQARAIVFEVPSFGVFGGVVLAADLAP